MTESLKRGRLILVAELALDKQVLKGKEIELIKLLLKLQLQELQATWFALKFPVKIERWNNKPKMWDKVWAVGLDEGAM